jgi:hypothetical protein
MNPVSNAQCGREIVSGRLPRILHSYSNVRALTGSYIKYVGLRNEYVGSKLPFGGFCSEACLISGSDSGIASSKGCNPCENQRDHNERKSETPNNQLQPSIIGGAFSGSRHALLLTQIGLVVILSVAAWGPIYLGIRFLAFGNPSLPSDFILTPRFLIGWSRPRLVGFFTLCCGLLLVSGGVWLAWLLRE